MAETGTSARAASGLLRNRNFLLLLCAYAVSAMGDHLSEITLLKSAALVSSESAAAVHPPDNPEIGDGPRQSGVRTHSFDGPTRSPGLDPSVDFTALYARLQFVFFVPFLLGPFMGALADHFSRRGLMITADLARVAILLVFPFLISLTRDWGPWGVFAPLLLIGSFAAVFSPARVALIPTIVAPTQLVRANGMLAGMGIIATMAAAVLGGFLADRYRASVAFQANAATFVVSALFLWAMRLSRSSLAPEYSRVRRSPLRDLVEGWQYVWYHRRVLELMGVAGIIWFCGPLVISAIPAIVRDAYGGGNYQIISYYRGLVGVGFIIGSVIVTALGPALRGEIAITWGLLGVSFAMMLFAISALAGVEPGTAAAIGAVGIILAGMFAVAVMAGFHALLQRTVANRFRGRVFGIKDLVSTVALLTATGMLGIPKWQRLDDWVGWLLIGVAGLALFAGVMTMVVRVRRSVFGFRLTMASHLNEFIAKFWWRFQRIGPSRVPREGPAILTANHTCAADPVFLCAAAPYRLLSFIIAAEYVKWPGIRQIVRLLDCVPVRRGERDLGATKQSLRHLQSGRAMGIFIEGGIAPPGRRRTPKDGVATLALKTGAPVIPAFISGIKYREGVVPSLLTRHNARIRMGPPVDLSEFMDAPKGRDTIRAASQKIYDAIWALAPPEERIDAASEHDAVETTSFDSRDAAQAPSTEPT